MYDGMPWTANGPIKYIQCTDADKEYSTSGKGSHNFRVLNVRSNLKFVVFAGGLSTPMALASVTLQMSGTEEPMHAHIARRQDPSEMLVMWASLLPESNRVRWGVSSSGKPPATLQEANATTTSYQPSDFCGAPADSSGFFDPGYFHHAVISGLNTSSTDQVFYSFGNSEGWSPFRSFAIPTEPSAHVPTDILVIADVGAEFPDSSHQHWSLPVSESQANLTYDHITAAPQADAILHVGDISCK